MSLWVGSLGGMNSGTWDMLYWQQAPHGLAEDLNISGTVFFPAFFLSSIHQVRNVFQVEELQVKGRGE